MLVVEFTSLLACALGIRAAVELHEQNKHRDVVGKLEISEFGLKNMLQEQSKDSVQDAETKLDELRLRDHLLVGVLDAHGSHEIVGVHDKVDDRVDEGAKVCCAIALINLVMR